MTSHTGHPARPARADRVVSAAHLPRAAGPLRAAVAALTVVLLGVALTGCVPDRPGDAAGWLRGQAGIVDVQVVANHDGEFQSSGISRGELAPDLSDERLASLIKSVEGYLASHDQVSIRLGRDGIDFTVSTDDENTTIAVDLWRKVATVPQIANAIVRGDNSVHARVLRPDAVGVIGALAKLGTDVSVEALKDAAAIANDTEQDDFSDDGTFSGVSLGLHWPQGCTPTPAERRLAESFFARDEIAGGSIELCSSFDLYYTEDAVYSTVIPALYGDVADADLLGFPVTAHQVVGPYSDGHLVAVTPGDPAAFAVLPAFEVPTAVGVYFTLGGDRSLDITDYEMPTADLLALVQASPAAASLPLIRLEGDTSAISGAPAQLPDMLAQVTALVATSDIFSNVELGPTTGSLSLSSPAGADPDVVVAARLLRDSGAWQGRSFSVGYAAASLTITDGIAVIDNPDYTDPHVVNAFIAAWGATA